MEELKVIRSLIRKYRRKGKNQRKIEFVECHGFLKSFLPVVYVYWERLIIILEFSFIESCLRTIIIIIFLFVVDFVIH